MSKKKILEVVAEIHRRASKESDSADSSLSLSEWSNDVARLNGAYNSVYCSRQLVGQTPQLPNTPLGFVAGLVVGLTQKLLFWYTPQLRYFHEATTNALNHVCSLEEGQYRRHMSLMNRVESLEQSYRQLRTEGQNNRGDAPFQSAERGAGKTTGDSSGGSRPPSRPDVNPEQFYHALHSHFQTSDAPDGVRLQTYVSVIRKLLPSGHEGPWLDLGCGNGSWLEIAGADGGKVVGVDASETAVSHCRSAGFETVRSDALEYLRAADDDTFSAITAFHVVEHCPFEYGLNLVFQAVRVLKPGGVLLFETPHPGNVLMAAEQFWIDPTHVRPIPMALMEFMFEYCGLRVLHRFEMNPRPESEHLPLRELELAGRLDRILYGAQDYAILGQL